MDKNSKQSVTIHDVARVAGVSKSTVSLVLQGKGKTSALAKEKVHAAIQQTGYVYNREAAALRSKSSDLVAIVVNDLTTPYCAKLAVTLENHIRALGFMTTLVNTNDNALTQAQVIAKLQEYRVRALVISPAINTQASWLNQLKTPHTQVVTIMRQVANSNVPCVLPNNEHGICQATQALLAKGHKHIAFIGGDAVASEYIQRLNGFNNALNGQHDIQSWVFNSSANRHGGRIAMSQCLAQVPQVESVVCFNDVVAYGAIEHLREQGLRPGTDISIIGFEDLDDSQFMNPPLSSIRVDADEIAKTVCDLILNNTQEGVFLTNTEFIQRQS
ncbi:LacI family DNA-binding transcriptional regulator [Pseudoalteromonas sp. JBTF-M23]|uniref:LacI family DNA-binding transcriptional regulator n=1 Tax=Pseudoalteromonas caenipelagi TaxID=2726988 RepID=A0A849VGL6_9GAMM|nr:LacI family DNA-binding transcriptional regulator [Pseudoalteromonas caenipelagi]NOU51014.1 LacI family DNA-binding transcriptional regulator [Pseudoalteromonas caenipelagi]